MTRRRAPRVARRRRRRRQPGAGAFTLIEVMISIALVLVLILGINKVFKVAADTVGAGQALSAKVRDGRAAQAVFNKELAHVAPDGPFLILDSRTIGGYRNAADEKSDLDGNPRTMDIDGNNVEGEANVLGERVDFATASIRNHRVDTLSFFARDLYPRQTGNPGVYVDEMSSNEAWVTYGHLRVYDQKSDPDQDTSYLPPGYLPPGNPSPSANPKNYYADDWVVGRVTMLLARPAVLAGLNPATTLGVIVDRNGTAQRFWARQPTDRPQMLTPLQSITKVDNGANITISDARYDLVGTTMRDFGTLLANYIEHTKYFTGAAQLTPAFTPDDWWTMFPTDPSTAAGRFRCDPYPAKPLDSVKVAHTVPPLLANCTQFIVEFAGDYLKQDGTTGVIDPINPLVPDGLVDFYLEHPQGPAGPAVRRIRWYGFPRDLNGDGAIVGYKQGRTNDDLVDVVPIRDVVMTVLPNFITAPPTPNPLGFERHLETDPTSSPNALPPKENYANPTPGAAATNGLSAGDHYTCAWGPTETNRPKMIRIIATVDDPNGHLGDGQTYEYVINLP